MDSPSTALSPSVLAPAGARSPAGETMGAEEVSRWGEAESTAAKLERAWA